MCGIAGFWEPGRAGDGEHLGRLIQAMTDCIRHRGPDHGATSLELGAGLALGHRRLAIVDLSPAGEQPMVSASGRMVIIYNGEVFNAEDIRPDLQGIAWRGHSDTEVMLEGFEPWGVEGTVNRLIGMFALAVWDRRDRVLSLVRDRLGIKPLYWTHQNGVFAFASELKALRKHPALKLEIDPESLAQYLRFGYVPGPASIFRNVFKLQPGSILTLPAGGEPQVRSFWDLGSVVRDARSTPAPRSDEEAEEALHALLMDAVGRRMVADVALGAFLSGGIDSSLVTALMQAQASSAVRTFSIGFAESAYDEAPFAKAVADHLGTSHTELRVSERDAAALIPDLPAIFDEPFADASQIPTAILCRLTRRDVTVALSGDGGDELFAGYTRYGMAERFSDMFERVPSGLRTAGASLVRSVPVGVYDTASRLLPSRLRPAMAGDRAHKLASVMGLQDAESVYRRLVSQWDVPPVPGGDSGAMGPAFTSAWAETGDLSLTERMQFVDTKTYLPDDILTKVDRASMAYALEARVPLLDHRVVAFAWSLPMGMKVRAGRKKWLLRQVLDRYVPRHLVERPKAGFGVPLEHWLRGDLRDWAGDLLDPATLRQQQWLDAGAVQGAWLEHQSGRRNRQYPLWTVLMFQQWLRHWQSGETGAPTERQTASAAA